MLELVRAELKPTYREKWGIRLNDFLVLTRNGKTINKTLYRLGGIGIKPDGHNYFMLLKHTEAIYPKDILKKTGTRKARHLHDQWCILDKDGIEKVVFEPFSNPDLIPRSCIYSLENHYYNIETGECYGHTYRAISSPEFLFLENPSKERKGTPEIGVKKINKRDGTW